MRIAIISGGHYKIDTSNNAAAHLYNLLYPKCDKLHMIRVDSVGAWISKGLVTDMHKVLPQVDHVIDLRYDKKSREEASLIQKLKLVDHIVDNYNNDFIKKLCYQLEINHPRYFMIRKEEKDVESIMHDMWRRIHLPLRVIPNSYNNSALITYEYQEALDHVKYLHSKSEDVIIEELVDTVRLRVVSIRGLRGKDIYMTLPHAFNNKYNKKLSELINEVEMSELEEALSKIYKVLDHKLLVVDFSIVKSKLIILGVSTKGDFTETGVEYKLLSDLGVTFMEIIKN